MTNKASDAFTLKNDNKIEITFTAHGGRLISIKVPDAKGNISDVVIGYDTVQQSLDGDGYFGALCGRYANRVSNGKFEIDGKIFQLEINNGPNHLHGGSDGFNNRVWDVEPIKKENAVSAYKLSLISPDGDQNYPGEVKISVTYSLNNDNEFKIEYEAETSKPTIINLTSHPYFNLSGKGDATNHILQVIADNYTTIDPDQGTCMGEIATVENTPFDFTAPKPVIDALTSNEQQIKLGGGGLDHNFVINGGGKDVKLAAVLSDPETMRKLEVYTDQPGIQVYTGNHFDGSDTGKGGNPIVRNAGIALETQIFPNSPSFDNFPNAVLRPGEKYTHTCIYKFI